MIFYRMSRQSAALWSDHSLETTPKRISYGNIKCFRLSFLIGRKMIYSLITYQVPQSVLICSNKSATSGRAAGMSYYSVKFVPVHCNQSRSIWFLQRKDFVVCGDRKEKLRYASSLKDRVRCFTFYSVWNYDGGMFKDFHSAFLAMLAVDNSKGQCVYGVCVCWKPPVPHLVICLRNDKVTVIQVYSFAPSLTCV